MAVDHIRYDILAQDALRGIVRTVLIDAATKGLPGDHHFYITFDTRAQDVRLSPRMQAQYPEEMTFVLQHQFWDLVVTDDGFEVGLSFGGAAERLVVPFAAITGFFDPSVQFGLQFQDIGEGTAETGAPESAAAATAKGPVRTPAEHKSAHSGAPTVVPTPANAPPPAPSDDPGKPTGSAEVVRLDRFRKK
jgi:uncharacterized protein